MGARRAAVTASLQRRCGPAKRAKPPQPPPGRQVPTCYNPPPRMLGRDWVLLVTGTLLGVLSLSADLLQIGAFPGFGWKQLVGTAAALAMVLPAAWRIFRASRQDRP